MIETTTIDGILNRRVTLEQPKDGYRVAVDTVFLAAAVIAKPGDRVLDMGCGVGGALLALACRVEGLTGLGIDIQPGLIEIFQRNIARNIFAAGLQARTGDVTVLPADLAGGFDHVLANPPYHEETSHDVSANAIRQTANSEKSGDLALWIASAAKALKPFGTLTLIHRADRQDEITSYLEPLFGRVGVTPLLPRRDAEPKRIVIVARKDEIFSVRMRPGFILHRLDGGYSEEAEAVLRHCAALL